MPRLLRLADVRQTAVEVAPPGYRLAWAGHLDLQRITGLSFVGLLVALPIIHELIHGAVAALVGARPVYGIVPPVTAFCHFERLVTRGQYAAITVAPLMVISLAGLALMPVTPAVLQWPLLALLISNAAGAIGDLWLLVQLRAVPAGALLADTAHGFEVYLPAA